ncbi:MAG: peptidylprolyl isomerase [Bacteroidales bacterium]|nr:peptidylprolyl isomerase [Bacteroidales bacterium]
MNTKLIAVLLCLFAGMLFASAQDNRLYAATDSVSGSVSDSLVSVQRRDTIVITTSLGVMKAVFYDDVPRHRAMYERRIREGAFDGTLFYRVVEHFMIQGGSPDSRNAAPGARIGQGSTQYLLLPEFRENHIARKGAIAAPRQPDKVNPQKKSDCSQFFIVQGHVYSSGYLDTLEMARNNPVKNEWWKEHYTPHKAEMDSLRKANPREYNKRLRQYRDDLDIALHQHPGTLFFTEDERRALTEQGGELNLNGQYTFFAEVVEGLEIIDRIAAVRTDKYERPMQDVRIISVRIK